MTERPGYSPPGRTAKILIGVLAVVGLLGVPAIMLAGYLVRRSAGPVPVACAAAAPSPRPHQTFATPPPAAPAGVHRLVLATSCGRIELALDADRAPRTVGSLLFLARSGFYDGTRCHRLVTSEVLVAVQCGDPSGTGRGGPGYTLPEENLGPAYARGTVAMARSTARGTTGSQFFLVARDSALPPDYTIVGRVTAGLDVLDRIVAVGHDGSRSADDGAPKQRVYLESVRS